MNTIEQEQSEAREKYGAFNSTHEAYAVLQEEVDEFWELVKQKTTSYNIAIKKPKMIEELTQIAAIAQRIIKELEKDEVRWV